MAAIYFLVDADLKYIGESHHFIKFMAKSQRNIQQQLSKYANFFINLKVASISTRVLWQASTVNYPLTLTVVASL